MRDIIINMFLQKNIVTPILNKVSVYYNEGELDCTRNKFSNKDFFSTVNSLSAKVAII